MSDNNNNDLPSETAAEEITENTPAEDTVESLRASASDLMLRVETLKAANEKLTEELAEAHKTLAAKPKGKIVERAAPKARKAGPLAEDKAVTGAALAELIAVAGEGEVEIVFSNGKTEIEGVPARVVEGDVWRDHVLGKMLRDPVTISGSALPTQLVGYALFIDGKQVAWTPRSDAINLAPRQSVQLADDIYFA